MCATVWYFVPSSHSTSQPRDTRGMLLDFRRIQSLFVENASSLGLFSVIDRILFLK